jgi:hypothetical protein
MNLSGNALVLVGILIIVAGLLMSGRLGPLGRLPGDIAISRPGFGFYMPITTMIVLSIVITLILNFLRR